ncbi:MAG: hypothetical protein A2Y23_10955 [Clostridiales bacterium GWB2_37_7]|nr:MAG: hypothetical protein A2Y23_10955 [Clostridiales bacterium GWB2_37_7]
MCKPDNGDNTLGPIINQQQKQAESNESASQEVFLQSFEYYPIDKIVESRMMGVSWKYGSPVDVEDLSYVKVSYWGFDEKPHIGELIVNKMVAKDIIEIFEVLYEARFPIDKIKLIDEYNAEDLKSMADNNTSAFCFREIEGKPGQLSKHSYGAAIDINPIQNPYVYKDKISPIEGKEYVDRSKVSKGMIVKGDACYQAFTSRGWT